MHRRQPVRPPSSAMRPTQAGSPTTSATSAHSPLCNKSRGSKVSFTGCAFRRLSLLPRCLLRLNLSLILAELAPVSSNFCTLLGTMTFAPLSWLRGPLELRAWLAQSLSSEFRLLLPGETYLRLSFEYPQRNGFSLEKGSSGHTSLPKFLMRDG